MLNPRLSTILRQVEAESKMMIMNSETMESEPVIVISTEIIKDIERMESLLERLANIDWCIGYSLTDEQLVELDSIRSEIHTA